MSGPKVVRLTTREEVLAICEALLSRLDRAIANWQNETIRLGQQDEAILSATRERRVQLQQMLVQDELWLLQKQVPLEINFIEADLTQRQEAAVTKAAELRTTQRNLRANAATLLKALPDGATEADVALVQALELVVAGRSVADPAAILAQGFARLSSANRADTETVTDAQRDLARALQTDRPHKWIAEDHTVREPRLQRIDGYLARLHTLYGAAVAEPFQHRLAAIEEDVRQARRGLLLDSLVLDLAAASAFHKDLGEHRLALRNLASELEAMPGQANSPLLVQIADCLAQQAPDIQQIIALSTQCSEAIADENGKQAAAVRRRAMLEGLASLGYEVREGMETAWADAGSVVLRKAATPGYGVELGGRSDNGRLQVRAVSLSNANDPGRDQDIETIWCSEFTRLRDVLAAQGSELSIEKALGVGAVPLKRVELEHSDATQSTGRRRTRAE